MPIIWGMMYHIFKNGWGRIHPPARLRYGRGQGRVVKWTPDEVERVTGVPENQVYAAAKAMADNRPGTFIWCMGGTQHTIGNNNTRAYCAFQLALGQYRCRAAAPTSSAVMINVRGATDLGVLADTAWLLRPGTWVLGALGQGLGPGSRHGSGRFDNTAYDKGRQGIHQRGADESPRRGMNTSGIPGVAVVDGVLEDKAHRTTWTTRATVHVVMPQLSQTRGGDEGQRKRSSRPAGCGGSHPTVSAVMHDRPTVSSVARVYSSGDLTDRYCVEPFTAMA